MTRPEALLLACDLDRTLIYSRNAMRLGEPVPDPVCVETADGREISYVSPRALARLAAVSRRAILVPTTTRTAAQFARVRLSGVRARYAVVANGGGLLVDGRRCADWDARVARRLAGSAPYDDAAAALRGVFARPWVRTVRDAERLFCYAVLDRTGPDGAVPGRDWFAELDAAASRLGWVASVQGRKAYAVPRGLTKEAALTEVRARTGATATAAAGDSLLDAGMLAWADRAIRPAHGELHDADWSVPGLAVTTRPGGAAAEEIADWFAELGNGTAFTKLSRRP